MFVELHLCLISFAIMYICVLFSQIAGTGGQDLLVKDLVSFGHVVGIPIGKTCIEVLWCKS